MAIPHTEGSLLRNEKIITGYVNAVKPKSLCKYCAK